MNPCKTCGREIRFRAQTVTWNRKKGCAHWSECRDGGACPCLKDWHWVKWRADKEKPTLTERKLAEWAEQNP